jgi:uncharacterized protein with HEPN domain
VSVERRLGDILRAGADADALIQRGHSSFVSDPLLIRAAKNILSEIGEAAKALDVRTTSMMPDVPWRAIKGMRDKVVHDYPELDIDLLWDTLAHGAPPLRASIERYLGARE